MVHICSIALFTDLQTVGYVYTVQKCKALRNVITENYLSSTADWTFTLAARQNPPSQFLNGRFYLHLLDLLTIQHVCKQQSRFSMLGNGSLGLRVRLLLSCRRFSSVDLRYSLCIYVLRAFAVCVHLRR